MEKERLLQDLSTIELSEINGGDKFTKSVGSGLGTFGGVLMNFLQDMWDGSIESASNGSYAYK
ncbi:hypothetical protein ACGE0T_20100 [Parabacteroides sp. APC149_11_2_Y6]